LDAYISLDAFSLDAYISLDACISLDVLTIAEALNIFAPGGIAWRMSLIFSLVFPMEFQVNNFPLLSVPKFLNHSTSGRAKPYSVFISA
jgi:hypothetical protein